MAHRHNPVMAQPWASATLAAIAILLLSGLLPILWLAIGAPTRLFDGHSVRILAFTLWQALLSTLLSLALALPAARALARRRFPMRNLLVSLLSLPMALPQIVVVLALVGLFGAQGWLSGTVPLYGLTGILIAHVFFNATLATRLLFNALQSTPAEQLRLAAQLGFSEWRHFTHVDWPVLRPSLVSTALLIFLLCAASFTIILTLGGGPQATTLEVAIYQALRADFEPGRAAGLALLQVLLCLLLGWALLRAQPPETQAITRRGGRRFDGTTWTSVGLDAVSLGILALLLLLPLAALVSKGLPAIAMTPTLAHAAITSLALAAATATVACGTAAILAHAAVRHTTHWRMSELASLAGLALSPAVVATGWFVIVINTTGLSSVALLLIITLNVLLALPYAYGAVLPAMRALTHHDRLAQSLNLSGWRRFWVIDRRALSPAIITGFAMCSVLSLGDLAAILFFGDGHIVTLPSLIYQQMGSYRMQGAMGTALILASLAALILLAAERARRHA